jgi:hypothetical protein
MSPQVELGIEPDCIDYTLGVATQKHRTFCRLTEAVRGCRVIATGRNMVEAAEMLADAKARIARLGRGAL